SKRPPRPSDAGSKRPPRPRPSDAGSKRPPRPQWSEGTRGGAPKRPAAPRRGEGPGRRPSLPPRPPRSSRSGGRRIESSPREAEGERLQKVLAHAGVASRRAAEDLMRAGRVWVDGRPATELGMRVDATRARIEVDGQRVNVHPDREYVLLNKPAGYVTTSSDPQGRPTVMDLVRARTRLYPIGRLDADTQGLLLLTNDGELTHRLTHPRYQVPKTYLAEVEGTVPEESSR